MNFEHKEIVYALPLILLGLFLLFWHINKKRQRDLNKFASNRLLKKLMASHNPRVAQVKSFLWGCSVLLIVIALARPQWGREDIEHVARGIDVMFALDVSKSMLAQDIKPSRLERAKLAIEEFVNKLKTDRVGLVVFTQDAFLQCPLTLDYNAFRLSLEEASPEALTVGGTNIAEAIRTADRAFEKNNNYKLLILLSDGEDLEEDGIKEAKHAAQEGMFIYTLGIGTPRGELIPIRKTSGREDFLRDKQGKLVKTNLDEKTLREIAQTTGGVYYALGTKGNGLDRIFHEAISKIPEEELSTSTKEVKVERFQIALAIALVLLTIESLLTTRRRPGRRKRFGNLLLLSQFGVILFLVKNASATPSQAYDAYQKEDYLRAAELYGQAAEKKPSANILYNLGSSLYKAQNYEDAIQPLTAALRTDNVSLQENIFYNLGNAYFKSAEPSFVSNPSTAIPLLESAIENYKSTLELSPESEDARRNLKIAEEILKKLKEQEEQNQNSDQEREEDKSQEDEPEDKKDKDNKSEDESSENEVKQQKDQTEISKKQILEALKGEEKKLPALPISGTGKGNQDEDYKDW